MNKDMIVEIYEAIDAGERALRSLKEAQQYLNSAGTWGLFDMFGGNLITGLMKHSKINNASRAIEDARYDLRKFQKELKDVDTLVPDVNIGDFLTFADFFWDGFVADIMVQSKVSKGKKQVAEAISRISDILSQLKRYYR